MEQLITKLVEDFEQGRMTRRQLIQSLTITAAATTIGGTQTALAQPSGGYVAKAVGMNHISYMVKDYNVSKAFYAGLFGMKIADDTGKECRLLFGDTEITLSQGERGIKPPIVDHIGLTIANWDSDPTVVDKLIDEVKRRGLKTRLGGSSFHILDPDGYDVQVGGKVQGRVVGKGQIDPSCPLGQTHSAGATYKAKCNGKA